ncbi:MAG TPA: right-handed parallel beta-helix repeat-containing protein [Anaerolineales bacterium]
MIKRLAAVSLAVLTTVFTLNGVAMADPPLNVYMSATGSDSNDGLTDTTEVKTLARVQQILTELQPTGNVEVRIRQGLYVAPQTEWSFYVPGHTISFMPIDYHYGGEDTIAGRPVFRGDATIFSPWWMYMKLPPGDPGNTTGWRFYYLQVERYTTGGLMINGGYETVDGFRVPKGAGANGNKVYGCLFKLMGSKFSPLGYAVAGIDGQNTSNNVFRTNYFENLENLAATASHLHGVYLAHGSHNNIIQNSRFVDVSGDPIRVRNASNGNEILLNRFTRAGKYGYYSEWFCDPTCQASNPGSPRECASYGNVFHDNTLVSGYNGATIPEFGLTPAGMFNSGGDGCPDLPAPRVVTYNNA